MGKTEKKSFVKGAAILGIAGLLCKIIGALFRIPLRNLMGVAGMTYYSTVYPYYSWLLVVSSSGLPTAISKLVSERVTLGDYAGAKRVFRKSLLLLTVIGLVTTALMFFGADALAQVTNCPGAEKSFRALAPALFFVSVMCAYRGYLQGLQQMTGTAMSQLTEQAGKLIISLLLVRILLPRGYDVAAMGALLGITASEILALIVIFLFYLLHQKTDPGFRSAKDLVEERGNDHTIRDILVIAIPVTIGASIMPLTGIVDTLLIKNIMLSTGFSREYADMCFAVFRTDVSTIINMPAVLTVALAMSLVPAISAACTRNDRIGVQRVSRMGLKLALIVGLPCAVGLYVIGGQVIEFLFKVTPEELTIGTALMKSSAVGIIFLSLVQTMTGCLQGCGRQLIPVINLGAGAVVKIVVMAVLRFDPALNIQGASISTVACYAVAGILDLVYLIRLTGMRVSIWDCFGKPIVASLAMGGTVYFAGAFLKNHVGSTVATLGSVAVGVVIYGALVIALRMFSTEELAFIPGGARLRGLLGRKGERA